MAQRRSGYAPVYHEHFPTPAWCIDALAEHIDLRGRWIWEPACGTGQMAEALKENGALVTATDITDHGYSEMAGTYDFLAGVAGPDDFPYDGIITNPPYGSSNRTAEAFAREALRLTRYRGLVAMLLTVDFDSASTRDDLFENCPAFAGAVRLTRRIKWFEPPPEEKKAGPSANHAWFIWSKPTFARNIPLTLYAPTREEIAE